ncbi:methyltransferase domain-containing protein [Streptosporangium sp. NPDC002524]|uniref:SAM-dependent methyltransferase n=1 Tax=Streptosporangium sp. NPDC002524 TaxID=3154537 RepID=UPI0033320695
MEGIARSDRHDGLPAGSREVAPIQEATERMSDFVLARLGAGEGSRVLDVGCGTGRPAVRLARTLGARVVAIDIDREALRDGAEHAAARGVAETVRFRHVDALDLPFADAAFDAVLACEVTPYLDIAAFYRSVARVLRPGGRLVVETPYPRVPLTEEIRERVASHLTIPNAALSTVPNALPGAVSDTVPNAVPNAMPSAVPSAASRAVSRAVSLETPEDHLSAARRAGMAVTELVDITENVRDSFSRFARGTRPEAGRGAPPGTFAAWADAAEVGGVVMTFTRMER